MRTKGIKKAITLQTDLMANNLHIYTCKTININNTAKRLRLAKSDLWHLCNRIMNTHYFIILKNHIVIILCGRVIHTLSTRLDLYAFF